MLEAFNRILVPGRPSYDRTKAVIDAFYNERDGIEKLFFRNMNQDRPAARYHDIRSISLPEELPARFGLLFDPKTELKLSVDYPGQNDFERDRYWSLKQYGNQGKGWWLSKNKGKEKGNEPFKRYLFSNPLQALKAVFDEFMANSVSYIKRKADYEPELWN